MSHTRISLCMIVKNEEEQLERCLQSVQGVVDEIILVDTGSTDATVAIARQFQARIFNFEWIDDFSAARNYGLEQATGDFILVLDADEFFEAREAGELKRDIASGRDFYLLRIRNHVEQADRYHQAIRLFKNHRGLKYRGRIHEHLNIEKFPDYQNGVATPLLHHVGYQEALYREKDKHARNLSLLQQEVKGNPSGYNLFNLGRQYQALGQYEEAFAALQQAFQKSRDSVYVTSLLNMMIRCLLQLGRYEEGIRWALEAIAAHPNYTDFYDSLGDLYLAFGDQPDAEMAYKKCLALGDQPFFETTAGVGSSIPAAKLAQLYWGQGKRIEAVEAAIQALQADQTCDAAVEVYLRALGAARVPLDEIDRNLKRIYPLREGADVVRLITVLYRLRHPLLAVYLREYRLQVQADMQAIADQVAGRLEEARHGWAKVEGPIPLDQVTDLLILAIQLRDESLLTRCLEPLQEKDEEANVLRRVVRGEGFLVQMVPLEVGTLLFKVCVQCLHNQHFETFEQVSDWLLHSPVPLLLELANVLIQAGYPEVAFELYMQLEASGHTAPQIDAGVGDLLLQRRQHREALGRYLRLLEQNRDFSTCYRLYQLYEQTADREGMRQMVREMHERFPFSQWVKRGVGLPPLF